MAAAWPDPCTEEGACRIGYDNHRIAIDADGNFNDPDDWAAAPMTLAILARAGLRDKVVHYTFNNHLGASDPEWQRIMRISTNQTGLRFGYDIDRRFFNVQIAARREAASPICAPRPSARPRTTRSSSSPKDRWSSSGRH